MTEPTNALIYETLKKVQADLASVKQTVEQHTTRFNNLENYMATSRRETADIYGEIVADRHAVDRLVKRIERIERRLELED